MNIRTYGSASPIIDATAFVDPTAVIIGRVTIGEQSSVWCNSVIRGDVSDIIIGRQSNIQDLTMLHVTHGKPGRSMETPLIIGDQVTIGHNCCIHACTIQDRVLVGMGSTVLDRVLIPDNVLIGAGSVVAPGKVLESGYLYFGNPLKQVRQLTSEEIERIEYSAIHYVKLSASYTASI